MRHRDHSHGIDTIIDASVAADFGIFSAAVVTHVGEENRFQRGFTDLITAKLGFTGSLTAATRLGVTVGGCIAGSAS